MHHLGGGVSVKPVAAEMAQQGGGRNGLRAMNNHTEIHNVSGEILYIQPGEQQDYGARGIFRGRSLNGLKYFKTGYSRKNDIEEDGVGLECTAEFDRGLTVECNSSLVALFLEKKLQETRNMLLVIHHEDAGREAIMRLLHILFLSYVEAKIYVP